MGIKLIDTTLREGLQDTRAPIFTYGEVSQIAYANLISKYSAITRIEAYMPDYHLSYSTWDHLATTRTKPLQAYVGPAHKFDINERTELLDNPPQILSTTLIDQSNAAIQSLARISRAARGIPLRVGIELAGLQEPNRLKTIASKILGIAGVQVVTLSDSSGAWEPQDMAALYETAKQLQEQGKRIGFHLHNGVARARDNFLALITHMEDDIDLEFDVSARGFGDRMGILATETVLRELHGDTVYNDYLAVIAPLLNNSSIQNSVDAKDQATSHYNDDGSLRAEYR